MLHHILKVLHQNVFRHGIILSLIMISACKPAYEETVDLKSQIWIHGSEKCEENTDPPIQVVKYNGNTWILRQNKCTNYEAPFIFLFFGRDKALLMDTGATAEDDIFPLYKTVNKLINDWSDKNGMVDLIVAHTHKHSDHYAADNQFKGKPYTTIVGLEVDEVKDYFKISNWPEEIVNFDLGNRIMKIMPIPGHQASSIAIYDTETKILLTGDTFYPGRLYVENWSEFKSSIDRLIQFSSDHEISTILGNHIEMTQTPGMDYPIGTTYQPREHQLSLSVHELKKLANALGKLGQRPTMEVHDSFIIYPID